MVFEATAIYFIALPILFKLLVYFRMGDSQKKHPRVFTNSSAVTGTLLGCQ